MAANHKLTSVLKGRTITGTENQGDVLTIRYSDGSTMTVKTAGSQNSTSTGRTVKGVRQQGTRLNLDFDNGSTMEIQTADETSSVMVRDKAGALEYAD